jgi:hypothetical protein
MRELTHREGIGPERSVRAGDSFGTRADLRPASRGTAHKHWPRGVEMQQLRVLCDGSQHLLVGQEHVNQGMEGGGGVWHGSQCLTERTGQLAGDVIKFLLPRS